MSIELRLAYEYPDEVRALFGEYTQMLIERDPLVSRYLKLQNYDEEIRHLGKKYGLPDGRLYLAYQDDSLAGCIALRRLDEERCELKRLYVRPAFRGQRLASRLMEQVISDAEEIGYKAILLDTIPFLKTAIALYRRLGFYEIPCYNNSPLDTTIYMKYDL